MTADRRELLAVAEVAARAGGEVLQRWFRDATLEAEQKAEFDYVSAADRESEQAVLAVLRDRYPEHDVLAEESGRVGSNGAEYEWVIDPLDGTTNFLQGLPVFAVSIACVRDGKAEVGVVLEPAQGNLFTAVREGGAFWNGRRLRVSTLAGIDGAFLATGYPFRARAALDSYLAVFRDVFLRARGIRRCGAAALDLAYTATGTYDGFFEFRLSPWDIAAGGLLIEEAGGRVTDLDGGERYLDSGNVIAGAPAVHAELSELVRAHVSEDRLDALVPIATGHPAGAC